MEGFGFLTDKQKVHLIRQVQFRFAKKDKCLWIPHWTHQHMADSQQQRQKNTLQAYLYTCEMPNYLDSEPKGTWILPLTEAT